MRNVRLRRGQGAALRGGWGGGLGWFRVPLGVLVIWRRRRDRSGGGCVGSSFEGRSWLWGPGYGMLIVD